MRKKAEKTYALLELERQLVGVKLVFSKDEFDSYDAREVSGYMNYCVAVKCATLGHSVKFSAEHSACGGSTRALGLQAPTEDFFNGISGKNLGLYCNIEVSAKVSSQMQLCPTGTYGVVVKPLAEMEKHPDVVLVVANSRNCMRLIQGYTYFYGMNRHFCMTGNQAVCVEGTVIPYMTKDINVSVFCSGTRFLAGWKDAEMVVGIPYEKFDKTIEGVRLTVNAVELDDRKKIIINKLESLGYSAEEIKLGETYYTRLEEEKRKLRGKTNEKEE